jgi:hypothetical protein
MIFNKSKMRREKKLEFGPQPLHPPKKFLTTKGLIIRGLIFIIAVSWSIYLLWLEFGGP